MPSEPEQFELSMRNNMVHETPYNSSIREQEDDDMGLSEGETKDGAEMIREFTPHSSSAVPPRAVLLLANTFPHSIARLLCPPFRGVMKAPPF